MLRPSRVPTRQRSSDPSTAREGRRSGSHRVCVRLRRGFRARAHVGVGCGDGEGLLSKRAQELEAHVGRWIRQRREDVRRRALHLRWILDAGGKQRGRVGQRAIGTRQVKRRTQASLGFDWLTHLRPCEARGFRFLDDARRLEETGSDRESTRPSLHQRPSRNNDVDRRVSVNHSV
jgi:hypothetical protein